MKRAQLVLLVAGIALVGFAVLAYVYGRMRSREAVAKFHAETPHGEVSPRRALRTVTQVDYSLWDTKRIQEYKASLVANVDEPVAILKMEKISLEVPVYEGTDDLILNRGVGWIEGTAPVDVAGNVGIAGHRDGFFRGLKDVEVGDSMELETTEGTQKYVIDWIKLVAKNDVSVLKSSPTPALTLVTCYPFYFIGSAPQRYIVHASLQGETKTHN